MLDFKVSGKDMMVSFDLHTAIAICMVSDGLVLQIINKSINQLLGVPMGVIYVLVIFNQLMDLAAWNGFAQHTHAASHTKPTLTGSSRK